MGGINLAVMVGCVFFAEKVYRAMSEFLPKGGGYRKLRVYHITELICDLSATFASRFIRPGSRTRDQIEQAARSGKQNIAEGSAASITSKETEIRLTNVAKASLEELLLDYEDYLRQHNLPKWDKNNPRTVRLRQYLQSPEFDTDVPRLALRLSPEEYCNMCITLINQATYMLKKLLKAQQEQFVKEGGIKERMYRARTHFRDDEHR